MSTRGYVGFYKDEKDIGGYNHHDSYPDGLGNQVLDFLRGKNLTQLKKIYASLNKKDNDDGDVWNWNEHCFNKNFRNCPRFLFNSLFCEYAYIINLDDRMLEFYVGFNENPDARGRYAGTTVDDEKKYYGVIPAQTIPLIDCYKGKWRISKNGGGFVKA